MAEYSDELVERAIALVRSMADPNGIAGEAFAVARKIAAELPKPVDPELVEARELIADAVMYGHGYAADPERKHANGFRAGDCDNGDLIQRALKMVRRQRELAEQSR